jgi:hypothetical protein
MRWLVRRNATGNPNITRQMLAAIDDAQSRRLLEWVGAPYIPVTR